MTTCPLDGAAMLREKHGDVEFGTCSSCSGAWVSGRVAGALLDGGLVLPDEVLRLGGNITDRLRTPSSVPTNPAGATSRERQRIVRCADCSTRMRPADGAEVAACIRCGGLWIPSGDPGALVRWFRTAIQLRTLAALRPTRPQYGQWRNIDEHGDFTRMAVVLVAAFAFFVIFAPLSDGSGRVGQRMRSLVLGLAGIGLVMHGFRHPSRAQPGALTRRGFGFALAGITLGVLAILDWS